MNRSGAKIMLSVMMINILLIFSQVSAMPADSPKTHDFSDAIIVCNVEDKFVLKAAAVLREEIEKRTSIGLPLRVDRPSENRPLIFIGKSSQMPKSAERYLKEVNELPVAGHEGFRLAVVNESQPAVVIIGQDNRGVLYGVGYLLRKIALKKDQIIFPGGLNISTSPKYKIRGHQLGYRPKTNSYDAWSVEQFDQYIRELALFGANGIEIMPPRTDDDPVSSHMKVPAMKMMIEQSRIIDSYGLDVWIWYPNMGQDYSHPDSIEIELAERNRIFKQLPRIDAVFIPGGDPGDVYPNILFKWLEQVAVILHRYHADAKIWVSPQAFRPTHEWLDAFFDNVNKEYPWFGGVVFGPWVKIPLPDIRKRVKSTIPIRRYPDITHSLSSQYPVYRWDLAYAMTLGRECTNPRPHAEKQIHNVLSHHGSGSISYSEGVNDDVNKFIWSDQDWDPNTPIIETLRDYSRLFIHPDFADDIAQGIVALEKNWQGPLLTNSNVKTTLQQWQDLESNVPLMVQRNYRFQMCLLRAYYDAFIQRRLIYETELQKRALEVLEGVNPGGTLPAIEQAEDILARAVAQPVAQDIRRRCFDLADSLFKSIGAQLSVEMHDAMSGRGNYLDNIDFPLNDAIWILAELDKAKKIPNEKERLQALQQITTRTNPGPGGFYDNFGSALSWSRVRQDKTWDEDPGSLNSPRISFGVGLKGKEWVHEVIAKGFEGRATPLAWMHQATALYDLPLVITYNDLDRNGAYTLRIAYTGRFRSKMKLIADDRHLIHDYIQTGAQPIYEFPVPPETLRDGILQLTFTCGEAQRGAQVAEIWLLKEK